jgi:hypothetical protein
MDPSLLSLIWLIPLGFLVGTLGTLIGAGGGFLLVPVLLLLSPETPAQTITSISLAVVFLNALSGSVAYSRMKRIDYRSGLIFAAAAVPGSVLGAWVTQFLPRQVFDAIFGTVLILVATYLAFRTFRRGPWPQGEGKETGRSRLFHLVRTVIDWEEISYVFSYNPLLGVVVSILIGFLSSLLGIGGGIFHVPLLATALNFPVHIATATSHFVLSIMTFSGTVVHIINGELSRSVLMVFGLGLGVVVGAQVGARLSNRLDGVWIIRILSVTLVLVGLRLVGSGILH